MADQQYIFMTKTVTITSGQTVSDAIDTQGLDMVQIEMPAAFTGITMTFQSSLDNSTFNACYNTSGTALSCTVAASRNILISPQDFAGVRYIKLVSGSAEGATRSIRIQLREVK